MALNAKLSALSRMAAVAACFWFIFPSARGDETPPTDSDRLYEQALFTLQNGLKRSEDAVRAEAARVLLEASAAQDDGEAFITQLNLDDKSPGKRVRAISTQFVAANNSRRRAEIAARLVDIALDEGASDSAEALESLALFGRRLPESLRNQLREGTLAARGLRAVNAAWVVAAAGDLDAIHELAGYLDNPRPEIRSQCAHALLHLSRWLPTETRSQLASAVNELSRPSEHAAMLAAGYAAASAPEGSPLKSAMMNYATGGTAQEKMEAAAAFGAVGSMSDLAALGEMLNDENPRVQVAAAQAILRIDRRQPLPFSVLDWGVIAAYAGLMLLIGWWFSTRNRSADDYMVGGRAMRPWAVGLSYFATLFSTISYLSTPGEMIRNGPMYLSSILCYPAVFIVVGYFLIPFIMRLRVTSAYEILETRFGLSVRMLGSGFFVTLRLAWMAFILFATSKGMLVPLMRLDDSATPMVAAALGLITVTYTAMGGIRAVIWTDVAQTFILLLGAIASMATISWSLGGATAWWPTEWSTEWETPKFWFDPNARVTLASSILSLFTWYVCTAGSDQMAIQRYLATRDAKAARRMFGINLWCDTFVSLLLGALGIALYAYFRSFPRQLPEGETVISGADELLSRYIVTGLPAGLSGLVVAGLLSAAMSSLASGLSSTSSVITVDWISRLRAGGLTEKGRILSARLMSWVVGVAIIALSFVAHLAPGNMLEAAFDVVNLLTAPLFVLFFMAMFIPWATAFGTFIGGLVSVTTAIVIAYTDLTGLSFLWIMPGAFVVGAAAGSIASLLPIGERSPMLTHVPELPTSAG